MPKMVGTMSHDGTAEVNLLPVLQNDDGGNRNGDKHGKGCRDCDGNTECEQWDGNQSLAKP